MALDARQEGAHLRGKGRGTDSSRLAALRVLRAAHADLKARLRRPPINLGHRYRDLGLITRLIELELAHLAGRTTSSDQVERPPGADGADESESDADSAWSDPWGLTTRLKLRNELQRYSAKRERLRRWLGDAERARADEAARARYEAIALSIPWRLSIPSRLAEATPHAAAGEEEDAPHAGAEDAAEAPPLQAKQRPEASSAPAPGDLPAGIAATPRQATAREHRRTGKRAPALVLAGGAVALALVVMLDGSEPRSLDPDLGAGPKSGTGSASQAAASPSPERDDGEAAESGDRRKQAARNSDGAAHGDLGGDGGASPADGTEPAPAPAPASAFVPTSAPAPAPVPTTPAPEPAPAPTPEPEPEPEPVAPAAEGPPEFGFEH